MILPMRWTRKMASVTWCYAYFGRLDVMTKSRGPTDGNGSAGEKVATGAVASVAGAAGVPVWRRLQMKI